VVRDEESSAVLLVERRKSSSEEEVFDHLMTTSQFTENPASLAVTVLVNHTLASRFDSPAMSS
jgi:hypothetical protein